MNKFLFFALLTVGFIGNSECAAASSGERDGLRKTKEKSGKVIAVPASIFSGAFAFVSPTVVENDSEKFSPEDREKSRKAFEAIRKRCVASKKSSQSNENAFAAASASFKGGHASAAPAAAVLPVIFDRKGKKAAVVVHADEPTGHASASCAAAVIFNSPMMNASLRRDIDADISDFLNKMNYSWRDVMSLPEGSESEELEYLSCRDGFFSDEEELDSDLIQEMD